MIRLTLFLLMLLWVTTATAQRDFREGFIITLDNDSIFGKVLYKDSEKKFEECTFLKADGAESVSYRPQQLRGYSVSDRMFLSRDIVIDSVARKVFAEVYAYGRVNLFFTYDRYFLEKNGITDELVEKKTTIVVNGSPYVRTDKVFQNVLRNNLMDCATVNKSVSGTLLSGPSLTRIVEKYNECFPDSKVAIVKRDKGKWFQLTMGLSVGHSAAKLSGFDGTSFSGIADPNQFGKDNNVYPGISLEFNSPLTMENLALHVDVFFQKNSLQSVMSPDAQTTTALSWEFKTINVPISVSYYFLNMKRIRIFGEAGVSLYMRSNDITKWENQTKSSSGSVTSVYDTPLPMKDKTSVLFLGGVGFVYKFSETWSVMLKARYENGEFKINDIDVFKANYFNQTFSIAYKF